jgi:Geminivirus Rep catalytic domain
MFNLYAKHFLLTYPARYKDYTLSTKLFIQDLLLSKFISLKANVKYMIVAEESSDQEDPYAHYHVYLRLDRKTRLRSHTFFDLNEVHGRYEGCKNYRNVIEYVSKDRNILTYHDMVLPAKPTIPELVEYVVNYVQNNSYKYQEKPKLFLDAFKSLTLHQQAVYALHKLAIDNAVRRLLTLISPNVLKPRSYDLSMFDYEHNERIIEWLKDAKDTTTLVLLGPSGFGKTEFAKAIFANPLFVRHTEQLKNLELTHDGIIYDDFDLSKYSTEDVIKILDLQSETTVNVKHSAAVIPKGIPRILTSNKKLHEIMPHDPHGAIARRTFLVVLVFPLFKKSFKFE